MFKYQQFEDSENKETELKALKYQHVDVYDNREGQSLDKYKSEGKEEDIGYISLFFVTLLLPPPPPQKMSNRSINMGKRIKSLNYLVYIPKIS